MAAFDVATIKPSAPDGQVRCDTLPGGYFVCHNARLEFLLRLAFGLKNSAPIHGAPSWLDDLYDFDAKAEGAGQMTQEEIAAPLLALFRERLGLVAHVETTQQTVYLLEQQESGAKMTPSDPESKYSLQRTDEDAIVTGETMAHFAAQISMRPDVNALVIDNTGLVGKFDFRVPYVDVGGNGKAPAGAPPEVVRRTAAAFSSTFAAVNSVGLRLRREKRDGPVLVIDRIHRPSEN